MTIFTSIRIGDAPGEVVYDDGDCFVLMDRYPHTDGHAMVIPHVEIDHWLDLDDELSARLFSVARLVGRAQELVFEQTRIGLAISGYHVPHVHVHVIPIEKTADLREGPWIDEPDLGRIRRNADALRGALAEVGAGEFVVAGRHSGEEGVASSSPLVGPVEHPAAPAAPEETR